MNVLVETKSMVYKVEVNGQEVEVKRMIKSPGGVTLFQPDSFGSLGDALEWIKREVEAEEAIGDVG